MFLEGIHPKSHETPSFSYGFPMVFLWFSYGFPTWHAARNRGWRLPAKEAWAEDWDGNSGYWLPTACSNRSWTVQHSQSQSDG